MTIDLASLDTAKVADLGAELELVHPVSGKSLNAAIRLAGVDSEAWRRAQRAQSNRRLKKRKYQMSAEELEAESLALMVECTLDWRGVVFDGRELECTGDNARMIYERLPWVREQVDEFMGDRRNYLQD